MTTSPPLEALLHSIDEDAAVELLRRLVRTPSVTGNEGPLGALVRDTLEACGANHVELFEPESGRPVVFSQHDGDGHGPTVMIAGHLDTVAPDEWQKTWAGTARADPYGAAVIDNAVWGLGACDVKAGIATTLATLLAFNVTGTPLRGNVQTLWVSDEESGVPGKGRSIGIRAAAARIATGEWSRPDVVIYVEPSGLRICIEQVGFLIGHVHIQGKGGYWSAEEACPDRPDEEAVIDPIRAAGKAKQALWDLDDALTTQPQSPLLGRPGLRVTEEQAGTEKPATPDSATFKFIRWTLPDEALDKAAADIVETVTRAVKPTGAQATVIFPAGRDHQYGGHNAATDPDHPAVRTLLAAVAAVAPDRAALTGVRYWSELSFFRNLGIPGVYWAPGNIGDAHGPGEHALIPEFLNGIRIFTRFVYDYCG